jgi:tRNA(Ile)-lysidine synthase
MILPGGSFREPLAHCAKKKQNRIVTDLPQRIENQIQSRRLLKRGEKILIAVSGGLDSMVLLHALKILSAKQKWKIVVAHFNHQLRGRASGADEKLVRKMAVQLKLPIIVESADVKSFAKKSKLSIEMAARKLRHEFFARVAKNQKIKTIALAHHADDQVELFFLRLLRGAGGEGLAGMKWKSPSPADKHISIIRPLLDLTKVELEKFARENKIQFRNDATNFSSDFLRNRIRNELLPLLCKKYQPGLNKTVLRLMEIVGAESDFVGAAAKKFSDNFDGLPTAVQRRALQMQLAEIGVATDFELVESLRQSPSQFVSIGANISVARNEFGEIQLREELKSKFNANELAVNLSGRAGEAIFAGTKFNWKIDGSRGRSPHQNQREFFDADKIGGEFILRHWRAGDRFQPIGLRLAVKLQDLFTNAKIPRARRRDLILATVKNGEIFWVEGLRISENFKITPRTKRRLIWRWKNAG